MNKFSLFLTLMFAICGGILGGFSTISAQHRLPDLAFSFAIYAGPGSENPESAPRQLASLAQLGPVFMVYNGNMIAGKSDDAEVIRGQWKSFREKMKALGNVSFFPVPGPDDVMEKAGGNVMQQIYQEQWGSLFYSFDYKNAHFIFLNSCDSVSGNIAAIQTNWLTHDLIRNQKKEHIFVFVYQPLSQIQNGASLQQLFAQYGVKAVFSNVTPGYTFTEAEGVVYLSGNGSSGYRDGEYFFLVSVREKNWNVALVSPGGIISPYPPKE
ncbi:MAG: hypothetical protein R3C61_26435 [Bacteroidia bacterium]